VNTPGIERASRTKTKVSDVVMNADTIADVDLTDRELALQFDSIGDNCELGLVQRKVGAEPLGMFRFAGAPLGHLLAAMHARFEGMADPAHVQVSAENGEYMIKLTKYDFVYHADVKVGEADPDVLRKQQVRTVDFLVEKLIGDLEDPTKILVFRQNEPLSANDLVDLRMAIAAYGPSILLWVQEARPGHPPGSVVVADDTLMLGFVSRLASRQNVPDLDLASWLTMLRKAHDMRPTPATLATGRSGAFPRAEVPSAFRTETVFGKGGNSAGQVGYGWSAPEDGYTWSIGDRSLLIIDSPGSADEYWLEMDVIPYVAPPAVKSQSLRIAINGEPVHTFDPLTRGRVGCAIPGRLLHGIDRVQIIMDHPEAASPKAVAGERDDRRLAIAFRSLSIVCN
jgi:hypothetical protein